MSQVNVSCNNPFFHATSFIDSHLQAEITTALRYICSIGHSNQQFHNATVIASLALSMCGERFQSRQERDAAEDILEIARVVYGVPTVATIEQLRGQWL